MNDDTLRKFEAFVNGLDAPEDNPASDQVRKILYVDLGVSDFEASQTILDQAKLSLGALMSDKPTLSPQIVGIANIHMQAALLQAKPELAVWLPQIAQDAQELIYITQCRNMYGDTMVNAALEDARNSPRTFYHSMQLRLMAQRFETQFDQLRTAFAGLGTAFSNAISESVARGFADVPSDAPGNREERRRAKYGTRRKKEGDQLWARRNNPKRRR